MRAFNQWLSRFTDVQRLFMALGVTLALHSLSWLS
jgi:hypothetical protein